MHAIHPGEAPHDWVRPGGLPDMKYRSSGEGMLSSQDVLHAGEMKKFKFGNEHRLYDRAVKLCNHCRTHKCSGYCLRPKPKNVQYIDRVNDADSPHRFTGKDMVEMIKIYVNDCRMHFGEELQYDGSGENNKTRGQPFHMHSYIEVDKNGIPKIFMKRNHPRVLQEPYAFYWYGSNNDAQKILVSHSTFARVVESG